MKTCRCFQRIWKNYCRNDFVYDTLMWIPVSYDFLSDRLSFVSCTPSQPVSSSWESQAQAKLTWPRSWPMNGNVNWSAVSNGQSGEWKQDTGSED